MALVREAELQRDRAQPGFRLTQHRNGPFEPLAPPVLLQANPKCATEVARQRNRMTTDAQRKHSRRSVAIHVCKRAAHLLDPGRSLSRIAVPPPARGHESKQRVLDVAIHPAPDLREPAKGLGEPYVTGQHHSGRHDGLPGERFTGGAREQRNARCVAFDEQVARHSARDGHHGARTVCGPAGSLTFRQLASNHRDDGEQVMTMSLSVEAWRELRDHGRDAACPMRRRHRYTDHTEPYDRTAQQDSAPSLRRTRPLACRRPQHRRAAEPRQS